jgi:hypothetical protein
MYKAFYFLDLLLHVITCCYLFIKFVSWTANDTERLKFKCYKLRYLKSANPDLEDKPRKLSERIVKQLHHAGVKTV